MGALLASKIALLLLLVMDSSDQIWEVGKNCCLMAQPIIEKDPISLLQILPILLNEQGRRVVARCVRYR